MGFLRPTRRQLLTTAAAIGGVGLIGPYAKPVWAQDMSTLKVRFDTDVAILDPGYMTGGTEIETQKAVLPFLVEYTTKEGTFTWRKTHFVKNLSQRDPTHIDFELESGLKWSRGFGELQASDVKYSLERMKSTDWSGTFEALDHVDVGGPHKGSIVLNQPFSPFIMTALAAGPACILSEKALEKAGGKFTLDIPATCGPYVYEHIPGQRVVFKPNPDWTGPKPGFDTINALLIEEIKAAELAFEAGEVACTKIGADTMARYTKSMPPNSEMQVAGKLQYMWMGMNTEHPKLTNKTVRRAIQHAVDVDSILQGAYSGTTEKSFGIVCPGLIGKRDHTKYYEYNPKKAKQLLNEAGAGGLELELRTLNLQERILASEIIQANLGAIGVKVKVIPVDSGPFWEMGQESKGDQWKDLQLWLMRYGTNPDPYEATQWFRSDQVGIWNWERWKDPEFDKLYKDGIAERDPQKRDAIYKRMQEIMEETGAYVWINHEPETFIHRSDVHIHVAPSGEMNLPDFTKA